MSDVESSPLQSFDEEKSVIGYGPRGTGSASLPRTECSSSPDNAAPPAVAAPPATDSERDEAAALRIPKFTGRNFNSWTDLAIDVLKAKFPKRHLDSFQLPLTLLKLSLNDEALRLVARSPNVSDAMQTLQNYYAPRNMLRYRLLKKELESLKAATVKDVSAYASEFNRVMMEMMTITPIDEYDMCHTFLNGLPAAMENMASMFTTLIDLGTIKLDINFLFTRAREEAARTSVTSAKPPAPVIISEPAAFAAASSNKSKSS